MAITICCFYAYESNKQVWKLNCNRDKTNYTGIPFGNIPTQLI